MKKAYIGWMTVAGVVIAGLVIIGMAPKWRHVDPVQRQLEIMARKDRERASQPPPEPGQGKVSRNVERALRFDLPVVAFYYVPPPAHDHAHEAMTEEQMERIERAYTVIDVQKHMLERLAAAYKGAAAVVEVTPDASPASFERHKVSLDMPTIVIYSADNREVWRHEGIASDEELSRHLAKLDVKPTASPSKG